MPQCLHQLIRQHLEPVTDAVSLTLRAADRPALLIKDRVITYRQLNRQLLSVAAAWQHQGIEVGERVGIYLPKVAEAVISCFAASAAGLSFVPVNPILKPPQVEHIINDCTMSVLVTQRARLKTLLPRLGGCPSLRTIVLIDGWTEEDRQAVPSSVNLFAFSELIDSQQQPEHCGNDQQVAAILYTSGSTGSPKGVVLSQRNMMIGAASVAQYLANDSNDCLLALLPLSFDYGFSQLTTAFAVGASVVLLEYLMPRDVIKATAKYPVTGIAAVPPLWRQLAELDWPEQHRLRYWTNSGGHLPPTVLSKLQQRLPTVQPVLMYGLTEAFRSTYLPSAMLAQKPSSMGIAIPHSELLIINGQGQPCPPGVTGELVHRGPLVAQGYWQDCARTAQRFKPLPSWVDNYCPDELAVWSGDQAYCDDDGCFYFVGRNDEMIKTSGYRVSPGEIEHVLQACPLIEEVIAFGVSDEQLGQKIIIVASHSAESDNVARQAIALFCRQKMPAYMLPADIVLSAALARNPNGKIDRSGIAKGYSAAQAELGK
ncbi:Long-chain-fatty-acid--CoA ligase [Sinobacterium norvegicum]|uniref:Long-chain-fatty-acid--CoA ligase n=1 Tax=Sinobacterium norvegicum TaxID=1641715 RepID=A0ABN8EP01_9GAMM|nr:acyl-CoA ligase (AMP-forming), exosortase A system-associated [Sinobacterium norvegicum]CAH0992692.1 Long-chain-fatty-acid--CoA ligase [Sinobacterium norvegicum]